MPRTIGLDIGTSAVRAVQVSAGGKGPVTLERLGQVLLPPGAMRDGEIVDHAAVAEAIKTLWSRYGLKGKKVALGVANQQVVVRQVDLPALPVDELRQSLGFQVQEYIPIPVEQAILDLHVIEEYETQAGDRLSRIMLVAAQRDMIEGLVSVVRQAKLEPVLVDLAAFAMLRSLAPEQAIADREGELLIDIGSAVTNIVVHENGSPRFVRILLMGGGEITEGLMSALGMSYEEAESAKADGTAAEPGALASGDETTRLVAERAGRFVEEIRGSLNFYTAQVDSIPVTRAIVTGGGALLPQLHDRLSASLRIPVDRGHPMQELKIGKVGLEHDELVEAEPYLSVAIGLALGTAE
jgi:type IV pilus assembly protein PilM